MANVGNITVAVVADVARYKTSMESASQTTRNFSSNVASGAGGIQKALDGLTGGSSTFSKILKGVKDVIEGVSESMNQFAQAQALESQTTRSASDAALALESVKLKGISATQAEAAASLAAAEAAREKASAEAEAATVEATSAAKAAEAAKKKAEADKVALAAAKKNAAEQKKLASDAVVAARKNGGNSEEIAAAKANRDAVVTAQSEIVAAKAAQAEASKLAATQQIAAARSAATAEAEAAAVSTAASASVSSAKRYAEGVDAISKSASGISRMTVLTNSFKGTFAAASTAIAAGYATIAAGIAKATVATLAFTAALLTNPITWVLLAIVAVGAAFAWFCTRADDATGAIDQFGKEIAHLDEEKKRIEGTFNDIKTMQDSIKTSDEKRAEGIERVKDALKNQAEMEQQIFLRRQEANRITLDLANHDYEEEKVKELQKMREDMWKSAEKMEKDLAKAKEFNEEQAAAVLQKGSLDRLSEIGLTPTKSEEEVLLNKRTELAKEIAALKANGAFTGKVAKQLEEMQFALTDEGIAQENLKKSIEERTKAYEQSAKQSLTAEEKYTNAIEEYRKWLEGRKSLGMETDPKFAADIERNINAQLLRDLGVNLGNEDESAKRQRQREAIDKVIASERALGNTNEEYIISLELAKEKLTDEGIAHAELIRSVEETTKSYISEAQSRYSAIEKYDIAMDELAKWIEDQKKLGIAIDPGLVDSIIKNATEDLKNAGEAGKYLKQVEDAAVTVEEKLDSISQQYDSMIQRGVITAEQKEAAMAAAKKDLIKTDEKETGKETGDQNISAVLKGTVAAYQAELTGQRRDDPVKKAVEAGTKIAEKSKNLLSDISDTVSGFATKLVSEVFG